jgi:hypothetical protein
VPRKVVPFQLKLDEPFGHTGGLPENRGWNDRHLSVLDFVVPEEGLEPSQGYPYRILSPNKLSLGIIEGRLIGGFIVILRTGVCAWVLLCVASLGTATGTVFVVLMQVSSSAIGTGLARVQQLVVTHFRRVSSKPFFSPRVF